jgi:opacity protein-like surface antigen
MKLARLATLTVGLFLSAELIQGPPLKAQALATAQRGAEITAFGGYMLSDPDYGYRSYNGEMFGANFTVFKHWFVDPSIEVRYDHTSNAIISEHAFLGGPRVQKDYGRFHPYADFLIGIGTIDYNPAPLFSPNDHKDSGRNFSIGGGVDYDVTRNFSAKVDFQQQNWNLGPNPPFQATGNYTLSPRTLTFGVTYHIPFSGLRKQQYLQ